jgi:hypothetical protein
VDGHITNEEIYESHRYPTLRGMSCPVIFKQTYNDRNNDVGNSHEKGTAEQSLASTKLIQKKDSGYCTHLECTDGKYEYRTDDDNAVIQLFKFVESHTYHIDDTDYAGRKQRHRCATKPNRLKDGRRIVLEDI